MAHSSTEAELIAACDAGKSCLYIRSILHDLALDQDKATILYADNKCTIEMASVGRPTKRTKHIDMRHFAIQSRVEQDLLRLKYVPTCNSATIA